MPEGPVVRAPAPPATLLMRGARVLDPRRALDGAHDVLIRDGVIAEIGAAGTVVAPADAEVVPGEGRHLFPAFVDPHVHLRTPGQEHKEDLETGTRAAAAGGFGCVVAVPNTHPVGGSAARFPPPPGAPAREARLPRRV